MRIQKIEILWREEYQTYTVGVNGVNGVTEIWASAAGSVIIASKDADGKKMPSIQYANCSFRAEGGSTF